MCCQERQRIAVAVGVSPVAARHVAIAAGRGYRCFADAKVQMAVTTVVVDGADLLTRSDGVVNSKTAVNVAVDREELRAVGRCVAHEDR